MTPVEFVQDNISKTSTVNEHLETDGARRLMVLKCPNITILFFLFGSVVLFQQQKSFGVSLGELGLDRNWFSGFSLEYGLWNRCRTTSCSFKAV